MALPRKGQPQVLQEIVEPEVQESTSADAPAVFLQEIKEPVHEEVLVEEKPKAKKSRKKKKTFGIF